MYQANYISKGLLWRMPTDGRLSKGVRCPWKGLEDTGILWKALEYSGLMVHAWILMDD